MKLTYKNTLVFCFIGYIVQAISINFIPLLFITFQNTYNIPLSQITLLVTINFLVQLAVDVTAPLYVDKIGYRGCVVLAHVFAALEVGTSVLYGYSFVYVLISHVTYESAPLSLDVLVSLIN